MSFVLASIILTSSLIRDFIQSLGTYSYLGVLISGIFFVYGFTALPATASIILLSKSLNPVLIGLIGGFGAVVSDLLIFSYVRYGLDPDIKYILKKTGITRIKELKRTRLRWIIPFLAGFIIASPLPDEVGTFIFGIANYDLKKFLIYAYLLNSLGIMAIAFLAA